MGEEYTFVEGYNNRKFLRKDTGQIFNCVNSYNRSLYDKTSLASTYFNLNIQLDSERMTHSFKISLALADKYSHLKCK